MHQTRGHERALLARIHTDRAAIFQEHERRQRAARLGLAGSHQLWHLEDVDGRKIHILGFTRIDPGECRVGGAEIDADLHWVMRSRTLNSSFQRRPSRATHHNCKMPVSVTTVSNDTGTVPVPSMEVRFTSMGESS